MNNFPKCPYCLTVMENFKIEQETGVIICLKCGLEYKFEKLTNYVSVPIHEARFKIGDEVRKKRGKNIGIIVDINYKMKRPNKELDGIPFYKVNYGKKHKLFFGWWYHETELIKERSL